jgi:phosphoenolpyruvate carboxykinase (ATP)
VGAKAYLVNTGWNGSGKRISIKATRAIISNILNGELDNSETQLLPIFNLSIPKHIDGVESDILDPRKTYAEQQQWSSKAQELALLFVDNFTKFTDTQDGKALVKAGPQPA